MLCDPGAVAAPLWASESPLRMKEVARKETMGPSQNTPSLLCSGWVGILLDFQPTPPKQPPPMPHPVQGLLSGGPEAPWAQGPEQINKRGMKRRHVQDLAPLSPWLGSRGWVGERAGPLFGLSKAEDIGCHLPGRAWWVTGESLGESCQLGKHTQGKGSRHGGLAGPPCPSLWHGWGLGPTWGSCWPQPRWAGCRDPRHPLPSPQPR